MEKLINKQQNLEVLDFRFDDNQISSETLRYFS